MFWGGIHISGGTFYALFYFVCVLGGFLVEFGILGGGGGVNLPPPQKIAEINTAVCLSGM